LNQSGLLQTHIHIIILWIIWYKKKQQSSSRLAACDPQILPVAKHVLKQLMMRIIRSDGGAQGSEVNVVPSAASSPKSNWSYNATTIKKWKHFMW
jgi:hypothetical protein